jgi:uncharacterized membrane protein
VNTAAVARACASLDQEIDRILQRARREQEARAEVARRVATWRRRRAILAKLALVAVIPGALALVAVGCIAWLCTSTARRAAR